MMGVSFPTDSSIASVRYDQQALLVSVLKSTFFLSILSMVHRPKALKEKGCRPH